MSESNTLFKLILALGIVFLFIGLLGASFPAYAGATASWDAFTNSISTGPTFPTFQNPFATQRQNFTLLPIADGSVPPASVTDNDAVASCDTDATPTANWWGCLINRDASTSYVGSNNQWRVILGAASGIPSANPILFLTVDIQCRTPSVDTPIQVDLFKADDVSLVATITGITCGPGPAFTNHSLQNDFVPLRPIVSDFSSGNLLVVVTSPFLSDVSYVAVIFTYGPEPECSSADTLGYIGCILSGFFNFIINGVRFLINGVVFIIATIATILLYIGSVVVNLFVGLAGSFGFLLALPNMPDPLQKGVAAFVIAVTAWIVYLAFKSVRGTSTI
jgi:hypothetical protein